MPVTPALRLIVVGHIAILLPLRLRGKGKWGVAAAWLGYSCVAHCELSREPFANVCRASVPDPKAFGIHKNALTIREDEP
jgi:hypothetical protein